MSSVRPGWPSGVSAKNFTPSMTLLYRCAGGPAPAWQLVIARLRMRMSLYRLLMASLKIACPSTGTWIREQNFISALRKAGWSGLRVKGDFRREGNQFVLPYKELNSSGSDNAQSRVAPVEIPIDVKLRKLKRSPKGSSKQLSPQPPAPPSPAEPSPEERARHMLTHLPYQAWCPDCLSSKGRENPHSDDCDAGVQKV